jgi:hypothetical protein
MGQFLQGGFLEAAARVGLGLIQERQRDVAVFGGLDDLGFHESVLLSSGSGLKVTERHTPGMVPLQGSGLTEDALVREDFGEALRTQVVVPQLGELLVLPVKLRVIAVIAFLNEAAPLLDGCVIAAIVEGR